MVTLFQKFFSSFVSSMWDSSWPSFDETIPVDINSSSQKQSQKQKISTLRSVRLNDRFSHSRHRFTSLTFDRQNRLSVQHHDIYSHSVDCTRVPWESLTSMVISLALVNSSHHWSVINWFLPCSNSDHCNQMDRIILCGRRDEYPGYLLSAHRFPRLRWHILYESQHGSTFVCLWLCSDLCMYDIDLHCISSSYTQV